MTDRKKFKQVLIIEDDIEISNVVALNLKNNGITTEQVHDGILGLKALKIWRV